MVSFHSTTILFQPAPDVMVSKQRVSGINSAVSNELRRDSLLSFKFENFVGEIQGAALVGPGQTTGGLSLERSGNSSPFRIINQVLLRVTQPVVVTRDWLLSLLGTNIVQFSC